MRSLLTLLFWILLTPPTSLWGFPYTILSGNIMPMYRVAIWLALAGVRIAGVRWKTTGLDQLDPNANYIFMSNHVSNLDPPLLIPLIPKRTSVLVKKELFKIPILGQAMRMGDLVPIDRSNREAAIRSVQGAQKVIKKGVNMVVFPEGTRSRDGRLQPLKKGAFYLAMETGVPIVPVTIVGTEKLLPKGRILARPGVVEVVFHPPIETTTYQDREALMADVRQSIATALPAERR